MMNTNRELSNRELSNSEEIMNDNIRVGELILDIHEEIEALKHTSTKEIIYTFDKDESRDVIKRVVNAMSNLSRYTVTRSFKDWSFKDWLIGNHSYKITWTNRIRG